MKKIFKIWCYIIIVIGCLNLVLIAYEFFKATVLTNSFSNGNTLNIFNALAMRRILSAIGTIFMIKAASAGLKNNLKKCIKFGNVFMVIHAVSFFYVFTKGTFPINLFIVLISNMAFVTIAQKLLKNENQNGLPD